MPKAKIPDELKPLSGELETLKNELANLLSKLEKGTNEVKNKLKVSTYGKKSVREFNKKDLSLVLSFCEPFREEIREFQNNIRKMSQAIEKGFTTLYVATLLRKLIPSEHLMGFMKKVYEISIDDFDEAITETAKIIVKRGEVEKVDEIIRKYLISNGVMVDIISMSPEEIKKEFENDEKYPDVKSIKEKLPDEFKSIVRSSIKKKETAIKKIIEEVQRLKSIRRLGPKST